VKKTVILVATVLLAVWLLREAGQRSGPRSAPALDAVGSRDGSLEPPDRVEVSPGARSILHRAPHAPVHGTFRAYRRTGSVFEHRFARLTLVGEGGEAHRIQLRGDSWSADLPTGTSLRVSEIRVDGRDAVPRRRELRVRTDEPVVIEADLAYAGNIRVVDASTARDLEQVTVVRARSLLEEGFLAPPPEVRASPDVFAESSPVSVPESRGMHTYWVGAAGYAWKRMSRRGDDPHERRVALEPGGTLVIDSSPNSAPATGTVEILRLTDAGEQLYLGFSMKKDAKSELAGMPPGAYRIQLRAHEPGNMPAVLRRAEANVVAGQSRIVWLREAVDTDAIATLEGEIETHGRTRSNLQLTIERIDASEAHEQAFLTIPGSMMSEARPGAYSWSTRRMSPGVYLLTVLPIGLELVQEVRPGEPSRVLIQLGELADLHVRVLDAEDGTELEGAALRVRHADSEGGWSIGSPAELAPGRFELFAYRSGYAGHHELLDLGPGHRELEIRLRPQRTYERDLVLRADDIDVPAEISFWASAEVTALDSNGELLGLTPLNLGSMDPMPRTSNAAAYARLRVTQPGTYRVRLPALPEHRRPEAIDLLVSEPPGATHTISLAR